MNFDAKIPIYLQIIEMIKKEIIVGIREKGEKLPSVREMAASLKVNVNTIQRAYQELEREKVTFTERGKGSFVTQEEEVVLRIKKEMANEMLKNFIEGMKEIGYSYEEIIKVVKEEMKED
ncbi:GntR family transcriptional regulator [Inediibacterium massiliense]|uniref:GntR family transcriptional regulator n=1 Tax=Inediibacterium massiliense TaxID=1658111 RepID=UPI0006B476EC|nr:GntR family transcriptional regulator [Inediibacterium massiliense]